MMRVVGGGGAGGALLLLLPARAACAPHLRGLLHRLLDLGGEDIGEVRARGCRPHAHLEDDLRVLVVVVHDLHHLQQLKHKPEAQAQAAVVAKGSRVGR